MTISLQSKLTLRPDINKALIVAGSLSLVSGLRKMPSQTSRQPAAACLPQPPLLKTVQSGGIGALTEAWRVDGEGALWSPSSSCRPTDNLLVEPGQFARSTRRDTTTLAPLPLNSSKSNNSISSPNKPKSLY